MDTVLTLRKRLHYLSAYLETCGRARSVRESVARALYPRDYLATDANMFSVRDLQEVKSGQVRERQSREGRVSSRDVVHRFKLFQLVSLLRKVFKLGEHHVLKRCLVCAGKGFICEVCRDGSPVYPFHLEDISQCTKCFTVFHK